MILGNQLLPKRSQYISIKFHLHKLVLKLPTKNWSSTKALTRRSNRKYSRAHRNFAFCIFNIIYGCPSAHRWKTHLCQRRCNLHSIQLLEIWFARWESHHRQGWHRHQRHSKDRWQRVQHYTQRFFRRQMDRHKNDYWSSKMFIVYIILLGLD